MDIITLLPEHLKASEALFCSVRQDFPNLSDESFASALSRNIRRKSAFGVFEGKALAGLVIISAPLSRISFLAVAPEYRRCGIGRCLVSKALELLGGHAELYTYKPAEDEAPRPSWSLYMSLGFREEGEAPDFEEEAVRLVK